MEELEEVSLLFRDQLRLLPAEHPERASVLDSLAICLSTQYQVSGKIEDLQESISLNRDSLGLYPVEDPDRATSFNNLANNLSTLYEALGRIQDLQESISLSRDALSLCPPGHPGRATSLNNLANRLFTQYNASGDINDLEESISLTRDSLNLRPPGHPDRGPSLTNLACVLCTRYEVLGEMEDLNESISMNRDAVSACPASHPDHASYITNLASALCTCYEVLGKLEDLEESISLNRDALDLRPPGHPARSSSLNNLASVCCTRYELLGETKDLEDSILFHREALILRPPGHPKHPSSLKSLAKSLSIRFLKESGKIEDLEESISLCRDALRFLPPNHPDRGRSLNGLAFGLFTRYEVAGKMEDLEESISLNRNALILQPPGHPDRPPSLNNLAHCLSMRYRILANTKDLEECISLNRTTLTLHPPGHPDRATSLNNLAYCLSARYKLLEERKDLEECIALNCKAISIHPLGHPDLATSLNNLGDHLYTRYLVSKDEDDLQVAIFTLRDALKLLPFGHSSRFSSLNNLAKSLSTRYMAFGKIEDLQESINLHRSTLELRPPGYPDRSVSLGSLAAVLCGHYHQSNKLEEFQEALRLYKQAAEDGTSLVHYRLQAAIDWTVAARHFQHKSLLSAYRTSLDLLNRSLIPRSSVESQQNFIATADTARSLASEAASAAIEAGKIQLAVEFLEQGRAMLWSRTDGYKAPFYQLREVKGGGELADRLETLGAELERFALLSSKGMPLDAEASKGGAFADAEIRRHRILSNEWEDLVGRIREIKGMSHFLKAPPFDTLRLAAAEGPVVLVNISKHRSDAVILLKDKSPELVNLSNVQLDDLRTQKLGTAREIKRTLAYLWDNVVSPIVDRLKQLAIPEKSRIWWSPTAELCTLPLHAAGRGRHNLHEMYTSSYTSTLSSLIRARSNLVEPLSVPKLLVVGEPSKDLELKKVRDEVDIIQTAVRPANSASVLFGSEAHYKAVLDGLKDHSWVHFACHGHLGDDDQPFQASFELHDRRLPLLDLLRARLPNAELAFLSACHSAEADSRTPDENIHLSAALQFCGFRSVVGTLWEMDDADGPMISQEFYKYMFRNSPDQVDFRDSAEALSHAIAVMRKAKVPLERWTLFVHIGA